MDSADENHYVDVYMTYLISKGNFDEWASRIRPLYNRNSGFNIEGKWESIGNDGFGQAQPGRLWNLTVITVISSVRLILIHSIRKIDGYILKCTSFLTSVTLSFNVQVISNDVIEIDYGDNTTMLERVD